MSNLYERNKAKKVSTSNIVGADGRFINYCPNCSNELIGATNFCGNCGQRLDWFPEEFELIADLKESYEYLTENDIPKDYTDSILKAIDYIERKYCE